MKRSKARRFLVTGGSGLLGAVLVQKLLDDGQKVKVLDTRYGDLRDVRTHRNLEFLGVGAGDLHGGMVDKRTVYRAIRNVSVVYHLAVNWNGHSWRHSLPLAQLFDVNVRGTLNLLKAARSQNVKHFLFSSSAAVYGETQRTVSLKGHSLLKRRVDEESACKPYLWDGDPGPAYAVLKLTLENLCMMYHHAYGLPVTAFRIEYVFTNNHQLKDGANVMVDDVVRAFLVATLNKKAYGQIFNLAYPVPYISIRKIQRVLGWKPESTFHLLGSRHLP